MAAEIEPEKNLRQQSADINLENVRAFYRFKLFFIALIFAVLSFAIQFPVSSGNWYLKSLEGLAWILLGMAGLLSLLHEGAFTSDDSRRSHEKAKLTGWGRKSRNWAFVLGLAFLMAAKLIDSFLR